MVATAAEWCKSSSDVLEIPRSTRHWAIEEWRTGGSDRAKKPVFKAHSNAEEGK